MRIPAREFLNAMRGAPEWMMPPGLIRRKAEASEKLETRKRLGVALAASSLAVVALDAAALGFRSGKSLGEILDWSMLAPLVLGSFVAAYAVFSAICPLARPVTLKIELDGAEGDAFYRMEELLLELGPLKLTGDYRVDRPACNRALDLRIAEIRKRRKAGREFEGELGKLKKLHGLLQRFTVTSRKWHQIEALTLPESQLRSTKH